MKNYIAALLVAFPLLNYAQSLSFRYDQKPALTINGRTLPNPWVGGMNACQFSTMKLNNDNVDDLVVYDRSNRKISTFLWTDKGWQYDPSYETAFPAIQNWMLLVDYDGDGKKDLFAQSTFGIQVLRNTSSGGKVSWQVAANPLITEGLGGRQNLYVASSDIPAIVDLDDDGDIDILTFDASGNLLTLQQNLSREQQGVSGLTFKRIGSCWGGFQKEYCNDFIFGVDCSVGGRVAVTGAGRPATPAHTGNTITLFDANGDGTKDLLAGFVSCQNIALVKNAGPNTSDAKFTSFDANFPAKDPINFQNFPAVFWEDVDGDGKKDLLATPNVLSNEGNLIDFQSSNWFYRNVGTNQKPDFQLVQKNFLQRDMLDLGERAAPALADLDGDGDLDLLVGNGGILTGQTFRGNLFYFENKGTPQEAYFDLVSSDYLGLGSSTVLTDLMPRFADLDGNGSLDLIVFSNSVRGIEIRAFYNQAAAKAPARYTLAGVKLIPTPNLLGPGDIPSFVDVDKDGLPDMLVGRSIGNIAYYRNTGTAASPAFQLQTEEYGGSKVNTLAGGPSLVVADLNGDQRPELISGDQWGKMKLYRFPDQPNQSLVLLDTLAAIGTPGHDLMLATGDLDGDQLPDLLIGTTGGGLRYLKNTSEKVVITGIDNGEPVLPWAYPNPTERYVTIRPPHDGIAEVISLSGQQLMQGMSVRAYNETLLDLGTLGDGTYLVRLLSEGKPPLVQKVVVWK